MKESRLLFENLSRVFVVSKSVLQLKRRKIDDALDYHCCIQTNNACCLSHKAINEALVVVVTCSSRSFGFVFLILLPRFFLALAWLLESPVCGILSDRYWIFRRWTVLLVINFQSRDQRLDLRRAARLTI